MAVVSHQLDVGAVPVCIVSGVVLLSLFPQESPLRAECRKLWRCNICARLQFVDAYPLGYVGNGR